MTRFWTRLVVVLTVITGVNIFRDSSISTLAGMLTE